VKYKSNGNAETRSGATSCAATSATRRTRRTRVGRARRGTGVTAGHCAAPAGAHPCHPWQVGHARWRLSTGRRTARGAPLAAGAAHVAGHAPGPSTRASGTSMTPPTPTDLPCANKPAPAVPRAHAHPPRATAVPPLAPPVCTSLQSTPPLPQALELFLVHPSNSPSRLLINPSRTIAGARVPATAAGPPPPSSPLRRSSAPGDLPGFFPRPHGSSRGSALLSIASSRTAVRVPVGASPLPLAGDFTDQSSSTNRSRVSPIDDPRRLFAFPRSTSPPASLPSPSGPRGES
jgi:hypothetical protein